MRRVLFSALRVYVSLAFGIFLLVAPWTVLWAITTEWIFSEAIRELVRSGWARGAVSGIGVVHLVLSANGTVDLIRSLREP